MSHPHLFVSAETLSSFQHADFHLVFQRNVLEQRFVPSDVIVCDLSFSHDVWKSSRRSPVNSYIS